MSIVAKRSPILTTAELLLQHASVEVFLQGQDKLFYKAGIQKLQKGWNKCIEVGGDYLKK